MHSKKNFISIVIAIIVSQLIISFAYFSVNKIIKWTQNLDIILEIDNKANKSAIDVVITKIKNIDWVIWIEHKKATASLDELKKDNPWTTSFIERYDIQNPIPDVLLVKINNALAGQKILSLAKLDEYSKVFNQQALVSNNKQEALINELLQFSSNATKSSNNILIILTLLNIVILIWITKLSASLKLVNKIN